MMSSSAAAASVNINSVVNRLYTPNYRPAVYDEEYVQNCTFQPRVYSTTEDARWEILIIGTNEVESAEEPAYLHT